MNRDDVTERVRSAVEELTGVAATSTTGPLESDRGSKRRTIAGVASIAIAAAGVIGIAALGEGENSPSAPGAAAADPNDPRFDTNVWACTGLLASDANQDYYESCVPVSYDPTSERSCVTPTVPVTWVDPEGGCAVEIPTTTIFTNLPDCYPMMGPIGPGSSSVPVSSAAVPQPSAWVPGVDCEIDPQEEHYLVKAGDTLDTIAEMFGVDPRVLANYNPWPDGIAHPIQVGDIVKIPPGASSAPTEIGPVEATDPRSTIDE
jgi:hypothetical protein